MLQTVFRGRRLASFLAIATLVAFGGPLSSAHAGLITGKGNAAGLCYLAYDVQGSEGATIPKPGVVQCTDGDACDTGPCGDNQCDFKVAPCINQPGISGCTPPTGGLKRAQVKGKFKLLIPGGVLATSACSAFLDAPLGPVKFKKNGKPKSVKVKLEGRATVATKGQKPKQGNNFITFECLPRAGAPASCPVPTTTTTTLPPVTACTTPCTNPAFSKLSFETTAGTTDCGSAGMYKHCSFGSPGTNGLGACTIDADCQDAVSGETCVGSPTVPPFSGVTKSSNGTVLANLGNSCLYLGGGDQLGTPPSANPDGSFLQMDACCPTASNAAVTLSGSSGTTKLDCTKGAGPTKSCANGNAGTNGQGACTQDSDCGVAGAGVCAPVPNCFFGPPLPIPSPSLSTCTLNVISTDGSGTMDAANGTATITLPLSSRVYLTGNFTSPCPTCVAGKCVGGQNNGGNCTAVGSKLTTQDCPPTLGAFIGALPVTLKDITTGTSTITADAQGNFCTPQRSSGGFGSVFTTSIVENGSPAGSLLDLAEHQGKLGGGFCVPASGNAAIDGSASLPGPGATSLPGKFKLLP